MGEKRLYTGGDAETAALSFKSNALDRDLLNMLAISFWSSGILTGNQTGRPG